VPWDQLPPEVRAAAEKAIAEGHVETTVVEKHLTLEEAAVRPQFAIMKALAEGGRGRIGETRFESTNGHVAFEIRLSAAVPDAQGAEIACQVVRPALKGTPFEGAPFRIYGNAGAVVADDSTPCP
jgi:hypothetical protein